MLQTATGTQVKINALKKLIASARVRDLDVYGIDTYHVLAGEDNPVLVHNCGGSVRGHPVIVHAQAAELLKCETEVWPEKVTQLRVFRLTPTGSRTLPAWRHPNVPDVNITLTGSRSKDFTAANRAAGLRETPVGYTWHHHQNAGRMQLIDRGVHAKTGHTGGFAGR